MKSVRSIAQLVAILGGPAATAEFFGVRAQQIVSWRIRNRIAPEYCLARSRLARRGIRVPVHLFGLHQDGRGIS